MKESLMRRPVPTRLTRMSSKRNITVQVQVLARKERKLFSELV